jgi:hypothetical protein
VDFCSKNENICSPKAVPGVPFQAAWVRRVCALSLTLHQP